MSFRDIATLTVLHNSTSMYVVTVAAMRQRPAGLGIEGSAGSDDDSDGAGKAPHEAFLTHTR